MCAFHYHNTLLVKVESWMVLMIHTLKITCMLYIIENYFILFKIMKYYFINFSYFHTDFLN